MKMTNKKQESAKADAARTAPSVPGGEKTPHPAASASTLSPRRGPGPLSASEGHRQPVNDVAKLPAEMRELVERMLVEGATFEDVCDAVNDHGVPVTLQAVQNRYRSDLELQKRRIVFQVERAQVLTQALADPDSSDAQLAHAALLTGLQTLSRNGREMTMKDAVKVLLERRNIRLKGRLMEMRIKREEEEKRFRKTRLHAEILKLRLTRGRLVQLERELKKPENRSSLGPVALEKIQEIYGLLQMPVIPRDIEVSHEEPRATGDE